MKKINLNLLLVFSLVLIFSSCTKKDKTGLLVPKDAAFVMHINSSSLSSKLSWDEIKATSWFQKIYSQHHDSLAENLLANPAKSGIDIKSDFVYFMQMRKNGAHLVIDGKLSDTSAFEGYCKKTIPNAQVTKEKGFSSLSMNDRMAIVWNENWFAYVINLPGMNRGMGFGKRNFMESVPGENDKDFRTPESDFNADSLRKIGEQILGLSDTKTLGTDKRFAELVKETGDIHFWINAGIFYTSGIGGSYMSMMKVSSLLEGNIYAATLNFDNGKIMAQGKHYYGEEMNRLVKKYQPKPVDAALINRLPSENVMAVLAWNYSPEGLYEIIKMTGMDGLINLFLSKQNFNIEDFIKANKGEMLLALTDVETKTTEDSMGGENDKDRSMTIPHRRPEPKFLLANAINNKNAFDRFIELLKNENGELPIGKHDNYTYQVKDNWFVVGDKENVSAFLSANNNHISFADRISGHPICAYINLQRILSSASKDVPDSSSSAMLRSSMNMWQDIVMTGGDYKNGATNFSAEVNLVNKTTNSLKQLNQYMDQIASLHSNRFAFEQNKMNPMMMDIDSSRKESK